MTHFKQFKLSIIPIVLLGLTGCSAIGDHDFEQLAEASKTDHSIWEYQQTNATQINQITDLIAIPELTQLINQAVEQNPSLQQTALALKIAYAQRGVTASDAIPELSAGFSGSKEEGSDASYSTDLTVSWELDVWKKLNDNLRASEMDIASTQALYQSARDILGANVMRAWLQINLQQQLVDIETQRLTLLESNEETILERYRSGLGELEELDTAHSTTASTLATLAEYEEQLAQDKRSLVLLIGANKQQVDLNISSEFPEVLLPLASLPEQDLGRRPDLQSAYYNIAAQQYRTDVAYKALLPSISLEVALSDVASSPTNALFASPLWSILGQLSAPLFQGGELRSEIEIAELTTEQTYWAYQETLLTAVNEVDNYLGQEQALDKQQQHIADALNSAKQSFSNYQIKYRQGLVDILDLLTVQQQTFDLQIQLAQITYNRLTNRIDLGLALGFGVSL